MSVAVSITETLLPTSFATRSKVRARVELAAPGGDAKTSNRANGGRLLPLGDANASRRDGEPRDQRANGRRTWAARYLFGKPWFFFDKSTAVHLILCTFIYIKMILTALLNREAKLDGMYVHFLELSSSHFSEERSQNPTPRERLACLEALHRRRPWTIR
jgi:hypothetical protein